MRHTKRSFVVKKGPGGKRLPCRCKAYSHGSRVPMGVSFDQVYEVVCTSPNGDHEAQSPAMKHEIPHVAADMCRWLKE